MMSYRIIKDSVLLSAAALRDAPLMWDGILWYVLLSAAQKIVLSISNLFVLAYNYLYHWLSSCDFDEPEE